MSITSDPKAWERYCKDLLRLRHGSDNFVDIPDGDGGDFGIEGYSITGCAYQCYLPENRSDVGKLKQAIQRKINNDLKKFSEQNVSKLQKLFGSIKITHWVLLTPSQPSSKLAIYCSEKTEQLRERRLPFTDPNILVRIHTEADYLIEKRTLAQEAHQLNLDFEHASIDQAAKYISRNLDFLQKLNLKLPKLVSGEPKIEKTRQLLVEKYLTYQNLLDELRKDYPRIWNALEGIVEHRRSFIATMFLEQPGFKPNQVLQAQIKLLADSVKETLPAFNAANTEVVTWGVVTDWLISCPLDFDDEN